METAPHTNTKIVQSLYNYFGKGDVPAILNLLTDDIKWTVPGPHDILPYTGVFKGKQQVSEFFKLINENKEFPKFETREFIEDGDRVVTLGYWDAKSRKTGKPYSGEWTMVFHLKNGKISEHQEFYDTYGEASASQA